jgi:acetyltransferase-like isoleucine patch superfamily enzyme
MAVRDVKGFESCICPNPDLVNLYECEIGADTKIGAFVEIGRGVKIGRNCKIQTGAFIPEGVEIGDEVFVGPNATFCNVRYPMRGKNYLETVVENRAVIGAGATILPGITIGENSIVGAGSVVVKSVPRDAIVKGNPAQ